MPRGQRARSTAAAAPRSLQRPPQLLEANNPPGEAVPQDRGQEEDAGGGRRGREVVEAEALLIDEGRQEGRIRPAEENRRNVEADRNDEGDGRGREHARRDQRQYDA